MDFRDLFRSFLGINRRIDPPNYQESPNDANGDQGRRDSSDSQNNRSFPFDGNNNRHNSPSQDNSFVLGQMLNSMEDMFREIEESMRDVDSLFQDFGNRPFGFGILGPIDPNQKGNFNEDLIPSLPPPSQENDSNVRSLVLKEPERVPTVVDKTEKIDKDLDDLVLKSLLPLSDIPLPPKEAQRDGDSQVIPTPRWRGHSSFERVYSTHSFKNGRWEGKTVKENQDGKEITTYTRNANGEQEETTEFIPHTSSPTNNSGSIPADHNGQTLFNPFQIFERLFKPRL